MALSIGIDYNMEASGTEGEGVWKTCLAEDGNVLELQQFPDAQATLAYIEQICACFPDPVIALSSRLKLVSSPRAFNAMTETARPTLLKNVVNKAEANGNDQRWHNELQAFLSAAGSVNLKSYTLPTIHDLPSIPRHRKLRRGEMGASDKLCTVVMLLYRMRQQDSVWPEMRFLFLDIGPNANSIIVVKDGRIVDALGESKLAGMNGDDESEESEESEPEDEVVIEEAFWESLTQDLAGLMALHHFEDVVVMDRRSADESQHNMLMRRLGDNYQFYLFPRQDAEPAGFEAAIGAALVAEGLYHPGPSAEVVQRLQIR